MPVQRRSEEELVEPSEETGRLGPQAQSSRLTRAHNTRKQQAQSLTEYVQRLDGDQQASLCIAKWKIHSSTTKRQMGNEAHCN